MTDDADAIEIDNRVLGADARRRAIDEAVREAFSGAPGPWRVVVTENTRVSPPWWHIRADGDGQVIEMSLRSWEQRADVMRDRVQEALRQRALAG